MSIKNPSYAALQDAIRLAGSQAALARLIGKKQPHIQKWLKSKNALRPEHCRAIELAVGVPRAAFRPDDYWVMWPDLEPPPDTPLPGGAPAPPGAIAAAGAADHA
ncbi:YdaS family helix-turn-helix protein [Achromobacter aloeverae]